MIARCVLLFAALAGTVAVVEASWNTIAVSESHCNSIIDILEYAGNFNRLISALKETHLLHDLTYLPQHTLFAPNDKAWDKLGYHGLQKIIDDKNVLKETLLYHVLPSQYFYRDLKYGDYPTKQGEYVFIEHKSGYWKVNEANIVSIDGETCNNGVVHEIDHVLIIPSHPAPAVTGCTTIIDLLKGAGSFNKLLTAIKETGLDHTLAYLEKYTLFAPKDDAWHTTFGGDPADVFADVEALKETILYHILPYRYQMSDFTGGFYPTKQGQDVYLKVDGAYTKVNDAAILVADKLVCNDGVVHVIDHVLSPCELVIEFLENHGSFDILLKALRITNLVDVLTAIDDFTLFAPTDDAWHHTYGVQGLSDLFADLYALKDILLYHLLPYRYFNSDFTGGYYPTKQGQDVHVNIDDYQTKVDDAKILVADWKTCNDGVIHKIDLVLSPCKTIIDLLKDDDELNALVTALYQTNLLDALVALEDFTLFAPTDQAWYDTYYLTTLSDPVVVFDNTDEMKETLLYHVLPYRYSKSELKEGYYPTKQGDDVLVTIDVGYTKVDYASIIVANKDTCNNGIIHKIDRVLSPCIALIDQLDDDGNFDILIKALKQTNLLDALADLEDYTLFAPTDDAWFDIYGVEGLADIFADIYALKDLLLYHVLPYRYYIDDFKVEGSYPTKQGQDVFIKVEGYHTKVNDAIILVADKPTCNKGIIHKISRVLSPCTAIIELLKVHGSFDILLKALEKTNLIDTITDLKTYTLLAPTDDAWYNTYGHEGVSDVFTNVHVLKELLLYHVLPYRYYIKELKDGYYPTKQGQDAHVKVEGHHVTVNDAKILVADQSTCNDGVVHKLDSVLAPCISVMHILNEAGSYKKLIAALTKTNLVDELLGFNQYTFLAPNDDAFHRLGYDDIPTDTYTLKNMLLYHILPSRYYYDDFVDGQHILTKSQNPNDMYVRIHVKYGGYKYVNDVAHFVSIDGEVCNYGIIHEIDHVLIPSQNHHNPW